MRRKLVALLIRVYMSQKIVNHIYSYNIGMHFTIYDLIAFVIKCVTLPTHSRRAIVLLVMAQTPVERSRFQPQIL